MDNTINLAKQIDSSELALLIEMYEDECPRTCALARKGHPEGIRALILSALGDEVQPTAEAACLNMRNRGWDWGAIHTTMYRRSRRAKSDRARLTLRRASKFALERSPE
jgi:hypothetical protein